MIKIFTKKSILPGIIGIIILSWLSVNLQAKLTQVSAQVVPVSVNVNHMDFGIVFPGEQLESSFQVNYAEDGNGVNYRIIQKRKPLPESHPEYPDGGDPDMPGYYKNLCPYLEKLSLEGEGDTEGEDGSAYVGPDDLSDIWTVYFKVPAIFDFVAQDHEGGIVDTNGEYGCDISIDVDEPTGTVCGYKFHDLDQNAEFYGQDYGLPGWEINLLEFTGCDSGADCFDGWEIIHTEITDASGHYCMDVQPGAYRIQETLKDGWIRIIPANPPYFQFSIISDQLRLFDFGNFQID